MRDEDIERMRRMEDFTFTASTGATVHMDFSLLRSMMPEEREARRRNFERVAQEIRIKYARIAQEQRRQEDNGRLS